MGLPIVVFCGAGFGEEGGRWICSWFRLHVSGKVNRL